MSYPKFPSIPRLNKPVIISEKIDGSNGQVAIWADENDIPDDVPAQWRRVHAVCLRCGEQRKVYFGVQDRQLNAGPCALLKPRKISWRFWKK
jgi:hypothetical protein